MDKIIALKESLKRLKLHGMAEAFGDIMKLPVHRRPSIETAVSKMIDNENRFRDDSRTTRLLKAAKLKVKANIEDVKCSAARNLTQEQFDALSDCGFVRRGENLIITGLTGCGKTFAACALGTQSCRIGLKTLYLNMTRYTEVLKQAEMAGTRNDLISKLDKNDLIILDDFGLHPLDTHARLALLILLDDRYDKKSMIICSQLPLEKWYDYIAEPTLADAIMDRLINSSHHIALEGDSMRTNRFGRKTKK